MKYNTRYKKNTKKKKPIFSNNFISGHHSMVILRLLCMYGMINKMNNYYGVTRGNIFNVEKGHSNQ